MPRALPGWKLQYETCPPFGRGLRPYPTTMMLDNTLADRQSEAGAFLLSVLLATNLVELIENLIELFRRDARTIIFNLNAKMLHPGHQLQIDASMGRIAELCSIRQQIDKHLDDMVAVDFGDTGFRAQFDTGLYAALVEDLTDSGYSVLDQDIQIQ